MQVMGREKTTAVQEALARAEVLETELGMARTEVEFMQESMADLELALEDRGWLALSIQAAREFSREGRRRAGELTRLLSVQNPLIKRGLAVRTAYVWGQGVSIQAQDPDVNVVVQAFLDANEDSFSGSQAREEAEHSLGTDGNVYLAAFTSPRAGTVNVRSFDPDEMEQIITNPEDRKDVWFYLRVYTTTVFEPGYLPGNTRTRNIQQKVLYPAMGFRPASRPKMVNGVEVRWDAPILHVSVNRVDGWSFGIGDAYPAIFWARAYKEFLEDWARITKALSRYTWRIVGKNKGTAAKAATEARSAAAARVGLPNESNGGATASMAGATLEAIPKTGATIDANSGRPLAAMVASTLGIPVTWLLGDPGQEGARAVAETLDEPSRLGFVMRQSLWKTAIRRMCDYVIDQSVRAPYGALRGTVVRDEYGREVVSLAGDVERTVDVDFPSLEKTDVDVVTKAIERADQSETLPELTIARLYLKALNVDNIDDVIDDITDEEGNFVPRSASAGDVAVRNFERGGTPVPSTGEPAPEPTA